MVVHKVMTKGAILRSKTPTALAAPMARPMSRQTRMPLAPLALEPPMTAMQKIFTVMTVAPTDRSMPPTRMTMACPRAMMPRAEACREISRSWFTVMEPGTRTAWARIITTMMASRMTGWSEEPFLLKSVS